MSRETKPREHEPSQEEDKKGARWVVAIAAIFLYGLVRHYAPNTWTELLGYAAVTAFCAAWLRNIERNGDETAGSLSQSQRERAEQSDQPQ